MKKARRASRPAQVVVSNRQKALRVPNSWVVSLATDALRFRKAKYRLSIALVDNREIRKVHRDFLDDDTVTDVITFDLREKGRQLTADEFGAELVISAQLAVQEAKKRKVNPRHELALYIIHGILHLDGYRDHAAKDKKEMRAAEKKLLARLNLPHVF